MYHIYLLFLPNCISLNYWTIKNVCDGECTKFKRDASATFTILTKHAYTTYVDKWTFYLKIWKYEFLSRVRKILLFYMATVVVASSYQLVQIIRYLLLYSYSSYRRTRTRVNGENWYRQILLMNYSNVFKWVLHYTMYTVHYTHYTCLNTVFIDTIESAALKKKKTIRYVTIYVAINLFIIF